MRIACYYPWVYLRSGIERTILETCRRSRHEYTVFTNHFEPENTYPEFKDLRVVELAHVPVDRKLSSVLKAAIVIGRQKLDLSSYDLLVVQCDGLGSLVLNRSLGIPAVCFCHTPLRPVYDPYYRARAFERIKGIQRLAFHLFSSAFRTIDRRMWSRYKYVFLNSGENRMRAERGGLLDSQESRFEVLHPGIDTTLLQPSVRFDPYFLVSGRIMWTKNIELAIRAFVRFKELSPTHAHFRLVIAGMLDAKSQKYLKELQALAQGRADIEFIITPSDSELRELYRRCYTVLFPPFNEDWGIVPLESNAFGKPVIACDRGGPKESQVHGETGFLVEPEPEEFAQSMALLAADPELARRMGQQGRKNTLQYDWSYFVNRMDDVLEMIARGTEPNRDGDGLARRVVEPEVEDAKVTPS
jgi:glycosyltransferase involved in cell wall biosynthesis